MIEAIVRAEDVAEQRQFEDLLGANVPSGLCPQNALGLVIQSIHWFSLLLVFILSAGMLRPIFRVCGHQPVSPGTRAGIRFGTIQSKHLGSVSSCF